MFPLGHAAFGYLLFIAYAAVRRRPLPTGLALVPLAVGTQFPDLVDKPLAYVDVLVHGRSLAHSVFAFAFVSGAVWLTVRRLRARTRAETGARADLLAVTPAAFTVGYASHLLGDAVSPVLEGSLGEATFLLYPLFVLSPTPADDIPPWLRVWRTLVDPLTHPQLELVVLAAAVFLGLRVRERLRARRGDAA